MMEEERLFPIDIHYNKLLDWLLDRRHCDSKWHSQVKVIQERVAQAQKTLPNTEQLAKITQTESPLTYFQCVLIFEELKTTEGEGKTLFGQYTSPRLKEWSDILKLYEKNNAFLAECAQRLMRNVNYEIPALKQQIAKWHQTQRECLRKEGECNVNSTALREKYEASCKEMGIAVSLQLHVETDSTTQHAGIISCLIADIYVYILALPLKNKKYCTFWGL